MVSVEEANRKFKREHPTGFFGKLAKSFRETSSVKAHERAELRALEAEAYKKGFRKARIARAAREGSMAGGKRWYDTLQGFGSKPPSRKKTSKSGSKHRRKRVIDDPFDMSPRFDIMDNWGFMK